MSSKGGLGRGGGSALAALKRSLAAKQAKAAGDRTTKRRRKKAKANAAPSSSFTSATESQAVVGAFHTQNKRLEQINADTSLSAEERAAAVASVELAKEKLGGIERYQEVFNPPGGYDPEPPDVDTLWTREQERQFIVNLLDKEKFLRIEFDRWYDSSRDERIQLAGNPLAETYRFPSKVIFTEKPKEGIVAEIIEISGRVHATVTTPTEETPVWIVTRWQDFRDLASVRRSWTELRGEFSP